MIIKKEISFFLSRITNWYNTLGLNSDKSREWFVEVYEPCKNIFPLYDGHNRSEFAFATRDKNDLKRTYSFGK